MAESYADLPFRARFLFALGWYVVLVVGMLRGAFTVSFKALMGHWVERCDHCDVAHSLRYLFWVTVFNELVAYVKAASASALEHGGTIRGVTLLRAEYGKALDVFDKHLNELTERDRARTEPL